MPRRAQKSAKDERRARAADHQRGHITAAAARCFAENGFDATTMRAIAEACGFTASSLYTYFAGKEEIFEAIVEDLSSNALAIFERALPRGLRFEQKLEFLFLQLLEFSEEHRDALIFMMSMHHGTAPSGNATESIRHSDNDFIEALCGWIESHSTEADLGGIDPRDVGFYVWGTLHGFFIQWLTAGAESKLSDKVPTMLKLILKGLQQ